MNDTSGEKAVPEASRLRFWWSEEFAEVWQVDPDDQLDPSLIAHELEHWSFPTEIHTRPATEQEIASVAGMSVSDFIGERGIRLYQWPVKFERSRDRVDGRAFDHLRRELGETDNVITYGQLKQLLSLVRFRNLPAGVPMHHYIF